MNGDLWFSEDGDRIFTKGKTVLKTSENQANDMIYNGSLSCDGSIKTLFHSKLSDKIFLVTQTDSWTGGVPASEVLVFNYSYLNYLESYPLEPFISQNNTLYNSEGNFVFANSAGTRIYVIVEADKSSGFLNDYAIQNIDIQ
jgi:hypothetical protein